MRFPGLCNVMGPVRVPRPPGAAHQKDLVMKLRLCLSLAFTLVPLAFGAHAALAQGKDVATLTEELKKVRDDADPKLVQELGALRTREAMSALLELYDKTFGSIYMRREVVKVLAEFDGVTDAQQPALQKLCDIATSEKEPELRTMAIETLANCPKMGKHFLKTVVESNAEDDIRERAMERVVRMATAEDHDFFERQFKGPEGDKSDKADKKGKKDKDAEPEKKVASVKRIREMAFEQIAQKLDIAKVYAHAREKEKDNVTELWGIRLLSLLEIERRNDKGLYDLAKEVYDDNTERGAIRGEAARIIAEHDGVKIAAKYLEDGRGNPETTPEAFRVALADQLARLRDDATDKKLLKLVGKGKLHEQRFVLRALRGYKDAAFAKALAKDVLDNTKKAPPAKNDPEYNVQRDLVIAALETLASIDDDAVLPDLQKVVDGSKDDMIVGAALDAITLMRKGESEWLKKLEDYAANGRLEVRNAALLQLGKTGDKRFVATLTKGLAHADWSTRLAALDGLLQARAAEGVGAIVAQMEKETGLMLARFADVLWKLTGKPHRTSVAAWKSWWEKEGASFAPISLAELAKLEADEEMRRLKQTTKAATFFGIRILSHRVIFVLDVSGSMNETLRSEYVGRQGKPRIEVAKEELAKCIDALEPESLFNIITFSSDVDHWLDGGIAQFSTSNKDEAKKFVGALGANGATNLYDSLKQAFADPDVDTIFVLSDGEPTAGEVTDQYVIRERVQQWNEHRRVTIHTIAVGGTFQILEWLAQDTGGSHRKFQ